MSAVQRPWITGPLGRFMPLQRGFDLPTTSVVPGLIPVVYSNGVGRHHNKAMVKGPGVVTGRSGTIGRVHYVEGDYWPHNTALWVTDFGHCYPKFTYYYLQSVGLERFAGGSGVPTLNRNDAHSLEITIPESLVEQRHISAALTDIDELIATLDQLITKKQAIKRGMMQHLLSRRADSKDTTSLGSVTSWLSGGTPNRSNSGYWSGTIPWISATTLKRLEVAASDQHVTPDAVRAGSKMAPIGSTLILVRGSALHSEIRAALVTGPVCFNQDVKALVPSANVVPKFLTYSIHGNADKLLRLVTSAGNTAGVLDTQVVKSFEIWLPNRSEQQRLVTVLDDVSNEIDILTSRLIKVKAIKQGMMQQLLTGRIRLPVEVWS